MSDYKTILVPYDFSEHSRAALATAADLARRLGSGLHLIHVIQSPASAYGADYGAAPMSPAIDLNELKEKVLRLLREESEPLGQGLEELTVEIVERPTISEAICEGAQNRSADLIVMGTHGRTGLAHVVLGSVAERTLRSAGCPVLTVQAPKTLAQV